ncbi:MAG: C39 family peptidase [Bacteroidota bacterium]
MQRKNIHNIFLLFIPFLFTSLLYAQPDAAGHWKPKYVGISSEEFDDVMTAQDNDYWCWAATAEIVLKYYGIDITQEQIVERMLGKDENGELPDQGVNLQTIHNCLNYSDTDNTGLQYEVEAKLGRGVPTASVLIEQLSLKKPVIVGYNTGNGGHIVVVTAVSYIITDSGPKIASIVVRDPMPDAAYSMNNGKIEYPGKYFARRMNAYWYINVTTH